MVFLHQPEKKEELMFLMKTNNNKCFNFNNNRDTCQLIFKISNMTLKIITKESVKKVLKNNSNSFNSNKCSSFNNNSKIKVKLMMLNKMVKRSSMAKVKKWMSKCNCSSNNTSLRSKWTWMVMKWKKWVRKKKMKVKRWTSKNNNNCTSNKCNYRCNSSNWLMMMTKNMKEKWWKMRSLRLIIRSSN